MENESQNSPSIGPFSDAQPSQKYSKSNDDLFLNFDKLSIQEKVVTIHQLESILTHMKEKSLQQLPLSEILTMLEVQKNTPISSNQNPQSPPRTPFFQSTPPKSASSISSSVPSSWSTPCFQPSPIQFNFKTPQKIFVFETNKSPKVVSKETSQPPETNTEPPIFNPPEGGGSKSLFVDLTNEDHVEESKEDNSSEHKSSFLPTASATFSIGVPPSNKNPKSAKRGNKKSDSVPSKHNGSTLFSATSQSQNTQPPTQPFVFGSGSLFSEQSTQSTAQPDLAESTIPDDDHMEIGQPDDIPPPAADQNTWTFPSNTQPFGNAPSVGPEPNVTQIPKKKSTSAIKRRLRSQKKGAVGNNDLSKLDNIFSNISLQPNPESHNDDADAKESQKPFIFFPPPPPSANENTSASSSIPSNIPANTTSATQESKPERDSSADARKIQMAEIFKREGKDMYSLQRYDLAYHAFTKCLQTAPLNWIDRPNILSNRAAALIMMERLVEAISDCDEAASIDPQFVKVYTRKGRALLKLGQLTEASDAFCYVLSWQPKEPETNNEDSDRYGKDLARQAMKQVVLAKTLRDRLLNEACGSNKQMLQTTEELLSLCPYMRLAQIFKAQALCQLKKWSEAKTYMELCVCSIHHTMQALHAHPAADFSLLDIQCLSWTEAGYSVLQVDVDTVVSAVLTMGSEMAKWYLMSLKNQDICRTSCSAESMLKYHEILLLCRQLTTSDLDNRWDWLIEAEKQIRTMISLKNDADEKFRNNLFMEAIQSYTDVLQIDENAHIWNAIMYGNRAASSMRLGMFNEAVSDCHQSLARDEFYSRAYLRRARAHRALGNHTGSIRDYRKYLKFDPKPVDWQAVEEELLEVLRSKNDDERFQKPASGSSGWTNSSNNSNRANKQFHFEGNETNSSRTRGGDSQNHTERENRQSANKDRRKSNQSKLPHHDNSHSSTSSQQQQSKGPIVADVTSSNYYLRLGVDSHATEQEIKSAYRKLALKYHPDKNGSENAADIFKSITEAYNQISDKTSRRTYDETLIYQQRTSRGGRR